MKQFSMMQGLAAAVALGLLATGPVAFGSGGTGGGGTGGGTDPGVGGQPSGGSTLSPNPCANLSVTANPSYYSTMPGPGTTWTVNTSLTNCSSNYETVTVNYAFSVYIGSTDPSCLGGLYPTSVSLTLKPGETKGFSFNEPVPPCLGTYKVVGTAVDANSGTALAMYTAFLRVGY